MDDKKKTKKQLLDELTALRQRLALQEEAIRRQRSEEALATQARQMDVVRAVTTEL